MVKKNLLVVTPTLGNRISLSRTINSVNSIDGFDIKHILVTPYTNYINLKSQYPDLEIICEPDNCKGIYESLNFALKTYGLKYTYLTFINDDDYWLSNYEKLIHKIFENDEIDVIYGKTVFVDLDDKILKYQTSSKWFKSFEALYFFNIILFTQQATIIKSEVYFKIGGFDEAFSLISDTKFWLDLIRQNFKFKYLNEYVAAYSIHPSQLSANSLLQKNESDKLKSTLKKPYFILKYWELLRFRFTNILVYFRRLLLKFTIKS